MKQKLTLSSLLLFFFSPIAALAYSFKNSGIEGTAGNAGYKSSNIFDTANLPDLLGKLISIGLSVIGVVLLGYLIYGGFHWLTSEGDQKKVNESKDTIKHAIQGLAVIFFAYALTMAARMVYDRLGLGK